MTYSQPKQRSGYTRLLSSASSMKNLPMMVPECLRLRGRMFLITEGHSRMSGTGPEPYFEARVTFN